MTHAVFLYHRSVNIAVKKKDRYPGCVWVCPRNGLDQGVKLHTAASSIQSLGESLLVFLVVVFVCVFYK